VAGEVGSYGFVSDPALLNKLLVQMLLAVLRETPAVSALQPPEASDPVRRLDTIRRARRELRDRVIDALSSVDADLRSAWIPQDLGDDRESIANFDGHMALTASEAMTRLRLTRQGMAERRKAGTLLGLPLGPREVIYPAWQFDFRRPDHLVRDVLRATSRDDPWGIGDKLTSSQPSIGGRVPIEVLRSGEATPADIEEIAALLEEETSP